MSLVLARRPMESSTLSAGTSNCFAVRLADDLALFTARHLVESLKSTPFLAYSFCSILEISRSVGPAMWSSISTTVTWEPATQ